MTHLHHPPVCMPDALPVATLRHYPGFGQPPNMLACMQWHVSPFMPVPQKCICYYCCCSFYYDCYYSTTATVLQQLHLVYVQIACFLGGCSRLVWVFLSQTFVYCWNGNFTGQMVFVQSPAAKQ